MSGDILISKENGSEVYYYLSGANLCMLVDYLRTYMVDSPVLKSDEEFKKLLDVAYYGGVFFLNQCSDEKVAEVARMLDGALDPEHLFWKNEFMNHIFNLEKFRRENKDADLKIDELRNKNRQMYSEISALIHQRLARHQKDEHRI
jgi:hypothetical protein